MTEPTRDQLAQDYAKALTIIDGLRTCNAELLAALKEVAHHADDESGFMVNVRAAIAKAEARAT